MTPFPLHRFAEFAPLSAEQEQHLRHLTRAPRMYGKGAVIRHEGAVPDGVWLLHSGWVGSAVDLPDAKRQLAKVHLPGDVLGSTAMCLAAAGDTVQALSEVVVSAVPFVALGRLFGDDPRLAAMFLLSVQKERLTVIHKLAELGRSPAYVRVAGLMLDLLDRGRAAGIVNEAVIQCPLTQEHIGDLLGLTPVHVNRMLRRLNDDGLISGTSKRFTVVDEESMRALLPFRPRYVDRPDWLPPPRV